MPLYHQAASPATRWPEPMETIWQSLPGGRETSGRYKRPDITLSDRLFIGAVVNIPAGRRPWGAITGMADFFRTSRQTLYTIGQQARTALQPQAQYAGVSPSPLVLEPRVRQSPTITVTETRLKRSILTLLLPGGVTTRHMQTCLEVAFDQSPSLGFLSELINEAGRRAGEILAQMDYAPLGEVVLARDETFFAGLAFYLSVEPQHHVIVSGYVETTCDAERWGVALQLDHQTRGLHIKGLVEDAARYYPASLQAAELSVPVQKDVWHIEEKAAQTVTDLERLALQALEQAEILERPLHAAAWDEAHFPTWAKAQEEAESLVELSHQLRFWWGCLCDALEVVDWRSGEIRERELNQWLLEETIAGLRRLPHPRVRPLVTYLERHKGELLTFLDWLEVQLIPWQRQLAQAFPDPQERAFFQAAVARAWRLSRAVVNGHTYFRQAAADAQALVGELIAADETAHHLAEGLFTILEGVIRTSCAVETVNSILQPYLWVKRHFQSRETAQNFLNLFLLWYNMHPFQRGKRQGQSPFQWAGIQVYTPEGREAGDWLAALGYPAGD